MKVSVKKQKSKQKLAPKKVNKLSITERLWQPPECKHFMKMFTYSEQERGFLSGSE